MPHEEPPKLSRNGVGRVDWDAASSDFDVCYATRVARVYLESSFFSACVSTRTDPKTAGWRVSSKEWWDTQASRHELFISAEVVRELAAPSYW